MITSCLQHVSLKRSRATNAPCLTFFVINHGKLWSRRWFLYEWVCYSDYLPDRGGQPEDHPVFKYLWGIRASRLWPATFLLIHGWLSWQDSVLQPRAQKLAHMHDAITALHISCMTFHSQVMPISQCNAQVFDCPCCLGGLAVDKWDLKAELLRFEAPLSSRHRTLRQHW